MGEAEDFVKIIKNSIKIENDCEVLEIIENFRALNSDCKNLVLQMLNALLESSTLEERLYAYADFCDTPTKFLIDKGFYDIKIFKRSSKNLSNEEWEIIEIYRRLKSTNRKLIRETIKTLIEASGRSEQKKKA